MSSPKTVAEVLDAAATLIERPGAWTQDWFAKDADGEYVEETSCRAVCWCMRGAVFALAGYPDAEDVFAPIIAVIGGETTADIETWNDAPGRTQAEAVAILREAAVHARAGAA